MDPQDPKDHMISNKMYDVLKYLVIIVLPALGTLYFTLSKIWGEDRIPNPEEVIGTLSAIATFGGVLLHISTKSYDNSDTKYDGDIVVTKTETGTTQFSMELNKDPFVLAKQDSVLFRKVLADAT